MNICILGQYPPQIGGIATYTKQLEEKLKEKGHNVYILTYPNNHKENNVFEANTINIPFFRGLSFTWSSYKLLSEIIDEYDIDIVHANYILPPGFVSALVKRKKDIKIIVTVHGSDINILANNKMIRPLIKYTLKNVDEVYFVSEILEEKALKLGINNLEEKSWVTPNTVNINKFKPIDENKKTLKLKYNKPLVIFIGNLVKQKGLHYLLEAKTLTKTDYSLLIYGEGSEHDSLNEYIQEKNIKDVYLMGKTSTPEKIIPESDIMILPSVSEGASIVALESMACQKAFITTNTGNISSIITNNKDGIIVPPKKPNELANAIDELILNKEKREKIGKSARELIIKKYSEMKIPYIN